MAGWWAQQSSKPAFSSLMNGDHSDNLGFEMDRRQRTVLRHRHDYLLTNIHATELFWSKLLARGVLDQEMLENVQVMYRKTQQTFTHVH